MVIVVCELKILVFQMQDNIHTSLLVGEDGEYEYSRSTDTCNIS